MPVPTKGFQFKEYEKWNLEIFAAIADYLEEYQLAPNQIRVNKETAVRVSCQMSAELVKSGQVEGYEEIGVFACPFGELEFVTDETLSTDFFILTIEEDQEMNQTIADYLKKTGKKEEDFIFYPGTGEA